MQKLYSILELWNLPSTIWNRSTPCSRVGKMLHLFPCSWNKKDYHYPLEAAETPVECWIFFAFLGWKCFQYVARLMLSCRSDIRTFSVRSVPPGRCKRSSPHPPLQLLCLCKCCWVHGYRNKKVKQVLTFSGTEDFVALSGASGLTFWCRSKLDVSHTYDNYCNYGFLNSLKKIQYSCSLQSSQRGFGLMASCVGVGSVPWQPTGPTASWGALSTA